MSERCSGGILAWGRIQWSEWHRPWLLPGHGETPEPVCAGSALTIISRTQNTREAHEVERVGEGAACSFSPSSSQLGLVGEGTVPLKHKHLTLEKARWKPLGPPCLPK